MKPKIVFLESSDIGVKYSGEAARRLGLEPIFFCDLSHYQADPKRQLEEFEVLDGETSQVEEVVKRLKSIAGVVAVTSLADTRLKVAALTAQAMGVAGIDPSVIRLKDKFATQLLVPEFSPPSISFRLDRIPWAKIRTLFRGPNGVVIKPTDSAGALGVLFVQDLRDLKDLREKIRTENLPRELMEGTWMAQAFVAGDLVSVEGFVEKGEVRILGFSKRRKVGSTESASLFPVDASLHPHARFRAVEGVVHLVRRSGFQNGYFHVEYILEGDSCFLIDANMGRVGGGAVAEQLALAFGHEPVEVFSHILACTLFPEKDRESLYTRGPEDLQETYAIFYGLKEGGCLRWVNLPQGSPVFHTQILGAGAQVSPMGRDDWSWIGIMSGYTQESLRVVAQIKIETEQGFFTPFF